MSDKKNGLFPGWPPFTEFKQTMVELMEETQKPIKGELNIVKESLTSHISETKKNFQIVKESLLNTNNRILGIEKHLSNHVTETDKKITLLQSDVSEMKQNVRDIKKLLQK